MKAEAIAQRLGYIHPNTPIDLDHVERQMDGMDDPEVMRGWINQYPIALMASPPHIQVLPHFLTPS